MFLFFLRCRRLHKTKEEETKIIIITEKQYPQHGTQM